MEIKEFKEYIKKKNQKKTNVKKTFKYNNKPTKWRDVWYRSKVEAHHAMWLEDQ